MWTATKQVRDDDCDVRECQLQICGALAAVPLCSSADALGSRADAERAGTGSGVRGSHDDSYS